MVSKIHISGRERILCFSNIKFWIKFLMMQTFLRMVKLERTFAVLLAQSQMICSIGLKCSGNLMTTNYKKSMELITHFTSFFWDMQHFLSHIWSIYIREQKFYGIRIISEKVKKYQKITKAWFEVFKKANTETIMELKNSFKVLPFLQTKQRVNKISSFSSFVRFI